jgi:hypothetical protein
MHKCLFVTTKLISKCCQQEACCPQQRAEVLCSRQRPRARLNSNDCIYFVQKSLIFPRIVDAAVYRSTKFQRGMELSKAARVLQGTMGLLRSTCPKGVCGNTMWVRWSHAGFFHLVTSSEQKGKWKITKATNAQSSQLKECCSLCNIWGID